MTTAHVVQNNGRRMRPPVIAALAVLLGAGLGLGAGAALWRKPDFEQKWALATNRAKDMPPGGLVIFGDSIVERQRLETLCGLPALNTGIGSARLADIEPVFPAALAARPARAVVAIGANDAHAKRPTPRDEFAQRLERLVATLPPRSILVGVTDAPDLNAVIKATAARHQGAYVEPLPASLTEDGLHLNRAGLAEWKRRVQAAC